MKTSAITEILKSIPIFSSLSENDINGIMISSEAKTYKCGDEVKSEGCITVILSGNAAVKKEVGGKAIIMRMMDAGGIFGVASLFSEEEEGVSFLEASKKTDVLFIPKTLILQLVRSNGDFAETYIRFLTSRIKFLNLRIKAYTSGSTEAKLAFHLLMLDEDGNGRVDIGVSLIKLAEMLDIGRASLYRAMDALCEKDIISRDGHSVLIKDRKLLSAVADGNF
ncbi:MAG: Crp/Fnr family transcriptional regulator [Ruminococcaceae bacterium]|nr:Crp/Fnr family transcriptional regulator [Oscillospiraceae bacterium]MBQ9692633.1 Crp/Fnr family transcriptional regulator [Clostridia bacterium]